MFKVGIDLGGSHIAIGVVDENGNIVEKHEKNFTQEDKKNLIKIAIQYITEIIMELKNKYSFSKIGLGIAGSISNNKVLRSVNLGIENYDIKKELEEKTNVEVFIKNDSKCAAIAEYTFGNCKNFRNVLFLALGTGIGGAFIYEGKLIEGSIFQGTEFGHMVIKENGLECRCGKKGCFEKYAGILALKKKAIERLSLPNEISGPELRAQMELRINEIEDIVEEYLNDLALGLSNLINIFEPDMICLGGGFAKYEGLLLEGLKNKLLNSNLLFNKRDNIEIQVAKFANEAGIIGASLI